MVNRTLTCEIITKITSDTEDGVILYAFLALPQKAYPQHVESSSLEIKSTKTWTPVFCATYVGDF
jgi:hypothetical protein